MPSIFQYCAIEMKLSRNEEVGFLAYLPEYTLSFTSIPPFNLSSLSLYPPTYF